MSDNDETIASYETNPEWTGEEYTTDPAGNVYLRIEPGEWYKRPACWVLGHEWRTAGEDKSCVRCGKGTLDGPVEVETDEHVFLTEFKREE